MHLRSDLPNQFANPQSTPDPNRNPNGGEKAGPGGFTQPSMSVRPEDRGRLRTSATTILGWRLGPRTANRYTTRPDNDYGMVWISSYGKGRVFNCALGHRPEFYETANMEQLLLAATQFVLGDLTADTTECAAR